MFKNNCDLESAKADWILECANEFKEYFMWEGINLRPAFIRLIRSLLNSKSANKDWFEKKLISKASTQDILSDLDQFQKSRKSQLIKFLGLRYLKYKISLQKQYSKKKPLIVAQHWKHVNYLKSSKLFDKLDPLWLVHNLSTAKEMGLDSDDLIVLQTKLFRTSNSNFPFNIIHDLAKELELSLLRLRPSSIFVVEGDAPYHALLAEIGCKLDIPVYCFQWGILHHNKLRTAFSDMHFTKFLSWGSIFEDQLKPFNPQQKFISFGPLISNMLSNKRNKIIFLSQYVTNYIKKSDQMQFIKLANVLAERFPDQVFLRPHQMDLTNKALLNLKDKKFHLLDQKENLATQLKNCIIAISIGSSSLIEALYLGVIPISFNTTCLKNYPFPLVEQGVGFEFKSFDYALEQITSLLNNQDEINSIQKKIDNNHNKIFSNIGLSQQKNYINTLCNDKTS